MNDTHGRFATSLPVVKMLIDAESWLEENQQSNNDVADDLVVGIEFGRFAENNTKGQANDEQDQANRL